MRTSCQLLRSYRCFLSCLALGSGLALAGPIQGATISGEAAVGNSSGEVRVASGGEVRLPYGVADVVKLAKAQVSEDVILSFIQNSGTVYQLRAADIIYLKDQVSNRILSAMLDQHPRAMNPAPLPAPQAPAPNPDNSYQNYPPPQQQSPVYVEPPSSSLYVIPSSPAYYSDYYQPYYYPSYGYGYGYSSYRYGYPYCGYGYRYGSFACAAPSLSFNFGFGGRGFGGFPHVGGFEHGGGHISVGGGFGHVSAAGHGGGGGGHSSGGHSHR